MSDQVGVLEYHFMSIPTMNTFDPAAAIELAENEGFEILKKQPIPVESLKSIIDKYCGGVFPDFLSLDVEGLDEVILKQIDEKGICPKIVCVESLEYKNDGTGKKKTNLISLMENKGYFVFADTRINTILVRNDFWFGDSSESAQ